MSKSQTATEYLIILAIVLVIALIVVGVLGGIPSIGGGMSKTATNMYLLTADIGIEKWAIDATGTTVIIRNNLDKPVEINTITLGNMHATIDEMFGPDQVKELFLPQIYFDFGEVYNLDAAVNYTDPDTQGTHEINHSQSNAKVTGTAPASPHNDLFNGLIYWYRFDDDLEDDISTHTAVSSTIDFVSAKANSGVKLNSSSDRINYTLNDMILPYNFTQSMWMRTKNTSAVNTYELYYEAGPSALGGVQFTLRMLGDGTLSFTPYYDNTDGLCDGSTSTSASYNDSEWHHVLWKREGSTFTYYVDGTQVGSHSDPSNCNAYYTTTQTPFTKMTLSDNALILDELQIWNRPLTDAEITELYQAFN